MLINAYKPIGKTPLEVIGQLRKVEPELQDKKIGYAGRLDPMAEGVLLLMVDPETKNRDKYQKLDKSYRFQILFGIETDSLDLLGLITRTDDKEIHRQTLTKVIHDLQGKFTLPYPAYSSKTVKGKPLFWWARNNRLDEIKIPENRSHISAIQVEDLDNISKDQLANRIEKTIPKIKGDFRQEEILEKWKEFIRETEKEYFQTTKIFVEVSSGTYVRSLTKEIAKQLNTVATTLSITRLSVGHFDLEGSNNYFR